MSEQESPAYESVEMNYYSKPASSSVQQPDIYTGVVAQSGQVDEPAIAKKSPEKLSCITKLLIVACIVNFVLLILTIAALCFFLTRTATKSEVDSISAGIPGKYLVSIIIH
jgi:hypothetical protein